jgi:hypothetical protein
MAIALLRSFERFEDAGAARDALLTAGLAAGAVQLRVSDDEAGPVEGNFLVGNGRTEHGRPPGGVLAGAEVPYQENFRKVVPRGVHLLSVQLDDEGRQAEVEAILDMYGGFDVDSAGSAGAAG